MQLEIPEDIYVQGKDPPWDPTSPGILEDIEDSDSYQMVDDQLLLEYRQYGT